LSLQQPEAPGAGHGSNSNGHGLPAQRPVASALREPLVSVVIPAYQCAQYIGQAIQSVLDQSFREYEIIVVNDGSPDTPELEEALQPFSELVRYFRQETRGPAGARNAGVRQARGKYLAFLDSDDYWSPKHLARLVAMLEEKPELDLAYCDCVLLKNNRPYMRAFKLQPQAKEVTFEALLAEDCAISTSSTLVRREALLAAGLFDEAYLRCEDFDMWLRLSFRGARMAYHPDAEVYHRINEIGLSANRQAMLQDLVRVYKKTEATLPLSPRQRVIIHDMVAQAEAEDAIEQLKTSLERKDFHEARHAATRAYEIKNSWKLRFSLFALRVSPRFFRALHLARAYILKRRMYSRRTTAQTALCDRVRQEERSTPLVHQ